MTTQIVYSEEFNKHNNMNHPENAERLNVMVEEIKKLSFYKDLEFVKPKILPEEMLYSVHSEDLITQIKDISSKGNSWLTLDTYICKPSYEIARLAAGGVVQVSKNVIEGKVENAYALVRPPGHHANQYIATGFCIFNNIAIAAKEITKKGKKVLIFDLDVHHGNGTQDIFYDKNDVLYQSFHLSPHYPGTGNINEIGTEQGSGFTINAPLSHGNGDNAVKKLMEEIFLPIANQFKPDIILVSSGFDSHHLDSLGGLKLTANFYGEIIAKLQEVQPKIMCTLEGGYNLRWIGKCLVSQIGKMTHNEVNIDDSSDESEDVDLIIKEIKDEMSSYWKL